MARFGNFVQIRDVINEELEALWAGNKSAKAALDAAVDRGKIVAKIRTVCKISKQLPVAFGCGR